MSIVIRQPAMVWNSDAWNIINYRMENSWLVSEGVSPQHLMGWSKVVFEGFRSTFPADPPSFYTLVINCHGYVDGFFGKGGQGLAIGQGITNYAHAAMFRDLAEYIDTIYIGACCAAGVTSPGVDGQDGNLLCSWIAQSAQAVVYASSATQYSPPHTSPGTIDSFEGKVYKYLPNGSSSIMAHM